MSKDYYQILEVDRGSSDDEIKKAYRKMAMKFHPDKNPDNPQAEEKFKDCAEAFDVLSDPQKKQQYDQFGTVGGGGGNPFGGGFGGFEDIFSRFGDFFGQGGRQNRVRKGSDLRMTVSISLDEVINGTNKKLKYIRQIKCNPCGGAGGKDVQKCSSCNGSGQRRIVQNTPFGTIQQQIVCNSCQGQGTQVRNPCSNCRGNGTVPNEEIVDIQIPKGSANGMVFNMSGNGNWGKNVDTFGDLVIQIEEIPDNLFKREHNNLIYDQLISVIDAILGKEIILKTPNGDIKFIIRSGTSHKETLRIQGRGVPDLQIGRVGDLFIRVNIKMPQSLTMEERNILESLKESKNFI
jgi:molecular chaperone DnaJ